MQNWMGSSRVCWGMVCFFLRRVFNCWSLVSSEWFLSHSHSHPHNSHTLPTSDGDTHFLYHSVLLFKNVIAHWRRLCGTWASSDSSTYRSSNSRNACHKSFRRKISSNPWIDLKYILFYVILFYSLQYKWLISWTLAPSFFSYTIIIQNVCFRLNFQYKKSSLTKVQ